MWRNWSLRLKVLAVTIGVVLPVMAASTALTVRLTRGALEDDIRTSGLALGRELAAAVAAETDHSEDGTIQQELGKLPGRGGLVREAAIYATGPQGLTLKAQAGTVQPPAPEAEIAAREDQEIATIKNADGQRFWQVAVPIREGKRSVGVVSLALPLNRVDALAQQEERQAILLGAATLLLVVVSLSAFMNRALTAPVGNLVRAMRQAEEGDLRVRIAASGEDEVGQLSRGLNQMLERVGSFQTELGRQVAEATLELRTVNQRLFAAQQQIARSERLAAAGEMAAAMAHDVGSPLTAVSGHLQLLAEQVADPVLQSRLLTIHTQVERAVAAAKGFLDAARPEPTRAPLDINALLDDLLLLVGPEVERKRIVARRELAVGLPAIAADASQMQELFLNLITNALESLGSGGSLEVTTGPTIRDGGQAGIRVVVRDTGPGMAAEVLTRVFEPFFTTRRASGGTGLGLAICRRIVKDHGGAIRLESEPGQGTRAIVELPVRAG